MQKNLFHRLHILAFPLIVLFLATLACGGTSPTQEATISTATSEPQPGVVIATESSPAVAIETEPPIEAPTHTPIPTTSPSNTPEPQPVFLGDVIEDSGYLFSALGIADPAEPGMLYEPETGKRLIAVEAIIGVSSGDPLAVNPLYFVLVDQDGFTYMTELGGMDTQLVMASIVTGEKVRGWVPFEIPEAAIPATLKYDLEPFGGGALETSLLPPPEGHQPATQALSVLPVEPGTKLGDAYEKNGYSLTATGVTDPAEPGLLYTPIDGFKLVAVEIIVGNVSGELITVNVLNTYLVDSNGYLYGPDLFGINEQITLMDLNPGEKVKGMVAFSIPEDAIPYIIKYQLEALTTDFLESGLTP